MNTLAYLDHLQKANVEELSFYPKAALERGIEDGLVSLAWENGQPAGYLYRSRPSQGKTVRIWQAAIEYDLRRQHIGAEMVLTLIQDARNANADAVQLRCRSSIEANEFWRALGFHCCAVVPGGKKRGAELNVWRLDISPALFEISGAPSTKQSDQANYRALRREGYDFGSRFSRPSKRTFGGI